FASPLQKVKAIEAVMESFERGAEVLASAVGELFPLCVAAAPDLQLAPDNVQCKEVCYVKEQFQAVGNKLDVLSTQLKDIDCEIKKGRLDSQYFSVEENIRNKFQKYMDILEAKPQFQEVKKRLFLEHFSKTGGEKNLYVLYDNLMGTNSFGESILEVVERYEARNRRLLEDFCVRMKELFCLGLIALLGHCWRSQIEEVESKMKACIEAYVAAFPEPAYLGAQRLLQEKEEQNLQDTAQEVQEFLTRKYDWVSWSVRVVNHSGSSWCARDHFQHMAVQNCLNVLQVNDTNLVVSYSTSPQPVPRDCIRQLMEGPGTKGGAQAVVEVLEKYLAGFVVHPVSHHKETATRTDIFTSFPINSHY
uniref:Uncharacterized protein n=1 Tax=Oncorhynchus tshawytscha TaxID=74940 RepID=A0A8C8LQC1_ONCTS